ncbi:MAG: DUF2723 domain-containing protein [Bacteroidaceae bacterium]|nr:DUF2723 domain-containing protein [Bacteroidaceae bacterium]
MKQFKIWNNALGWFTFIIAALTYCLTVEPTASFWDCPEFILSGNKLEIGHPPGAPFFMLTANFFSMFAGPEKVAYMVNIMSALLSAGGILFLFWSITHLTRKLIVGNSKEIGASQMITILGSGLVGALAYTWSDTYWFSAVEGEVYGYSSLFTAVVFWLILKWEDNANAPHSDRWLVLIAYLVGLSIGVHLLNLLCIPAIVLVVYYKRYPNASFKGSLLALAISAAIVMVVLYGIVPGVVKVGGWFELLFVNLLGLSFNTGLYIYILLLFGTLIAGIYCTEKSKSQKTIAAIFTLAIALLGIPFYGNSVGGSIVLGLIVLAAIYIVCTRNKVTYKGAETNTKYLISRRAFNTSFLSLLLIMIGYSSYALIVIRSSANTPMDQNSPEDIFTLGSYLNREQYGSRPLFYGECFDAEVDRDNNGEAVSVRTSPIYMRVEKKSATDPDEYEIIDYNKKYQFVQNMFFPRMYSSDHAGEYERWIGKNIKKTVRAKFPDLRKQQRKPLEVKVPTQVDNIRFFVNYQMNHMYWRYFLWNFVGRQNDIQNNYGEKEYGNWITGIPVVDNLRLGDQSKLPQTIRDNEGRNVFFALPLILGIIGIAWQLNNGKKGKQQFWMVFMLFFMTGIAIVLYLNQTPLQPRERDYAYAGSFYAFAIWIGMGVAGIVDFIRKHTKKESALANSLVAIACLLVPAQMVSQTWDDHDRSGRYACRDFGLNYLNTLPDEGCPIIFTCGDNDTFPLWYSQEVEGERTDARVCNLSYLQTDWYTDQMKRPAYNSPSLPITWDRINYAGNTNIYVYVFPMEDFIMQYRNAFPEKFEKAFGKNPFEMNKITKHWILEANAPKKSEARKVVDEIITLYEKAINEGRSRRERIEIPKSIIPCETLYIPIDAEAVMRSGMVIPEEYAENMPEYMPIDISDKSVLYRHELIIFDMLANANWERPLYMSMTVGEKNYPAVLTKFFVHEGLAYRITPFDWSKLGYDTGSGEHPVDIDRFCDNVLNRFKWGGVKEHKGYYADETIRRMISTHRNLIAQLATDMLNSEVEDARIISVLEKVYSEFPSETIPYDALRDNTISLADVYNIIYNVQTDYKKEIANLADSDDLVKLNILKEFYLGDDTLAMLKQRRDEMANSILKNELEHLKWYNTLRPNELNDVMLYHRVSLINHSWELLENGNSSNIAREEIIDALCISFNRMVEMHDRTHNKNDREMKKMVIGSIYQTLNDLDMSNAEMHKIEQALRRLMKQSK